MRVVVADSLDEAREVILGSLLFRFIALTRASEASLMMCSSESAAPGMAASTV